MGLVRWVVLSAVVLALAAGGYLLFSFLRPAVTVTEVVEGPIVQAFYATGTISPVREYPVKSPVAGTVELLEGVPLVDKGSRVKKGQPLARVTDPELIFAADRTAAELEEMQARADAKTSPVLREFDAKIEATQELLEIARREQRRLMQAVESRAASQFDLDRALDRVKGLSGEVESLKAQRAASVLKLKSDLRVAEAAHRTALWNVEQQTLKSPVDGVVLDRPVSPGTRLAVNDHVMLIADVRPENLVMRAAVDEEDMVKVHLKQLVQMTLYSFPGVAFEGRVTQIYDKADPDRRTFEVDITLTEPNERLAAGMTGELAFVMAVRDDVPVVPAQALQNGKLYTIRNGRLAAVDAQIGLKSVERIEVVSGLAPGETVVISSVDGLATGQPVRITSRLDPRTAAGLNKPKEKDIFRGGF